MLVNIFSVIADQASAIFGVLLIIVLSQILVTIALKKIFDNQLTTNEYFALGITGWLLPTALLATLPFLFGWRPSASFNLFFIISLFGISTFFLLRLNHHPEPDSKLTILFLFLFLVVSIALRFALISKAILPSYFDSAEHYLLIKNILGNSNGIITLLTTNYYHLGFHFIAAFAASTFQIEIAKTMLILGQIVLAILPFSLFFIVRYASNSNTAGIFAICLAAFGWYMPAHTMDWGKYPALTSLGLIPFVLSLAYLFAQNKNMLSTGKQRALYILIGIGILVSGFIHSRALVIIGIVFMSWTIVTWQQKLPRAQRIVLFLTVIVAIILEIIYIQKQNILTLLFDPYINKSIGITASVLFLSIFAQRQYPQLTLTGILTICFLLGSLFIPVLGLIPGHDNLTLLDRPFVEMFLFMPLAFIGGLGLAGLGSALQQKIIKPQFIGLFAITLVLINAYYTYNLYPSDCCVIVGNDDVTAMDWINNKLPVNARIGISATELKVISSEVSEGYVGGDAGIWITPLTGRVTFPIRYDANFSDQNTLANLCRMKLNYLYIGELGQNFNEAQISAQTAWYKVILSMPKVKVYEVVGCK